MRITKRLGYMLLAAFLILFGSNMFLSLPRPIVPEILGILAIAAGIALLLDK